MSSSPLADRLPSRIEASAVKRLTYDTEVVSTQGGVEFRNRNRTRAIAEWDITVPLVKRNSTDYLQTVALFTATYGSHLTFNFHDVEECADVEVRFKDDLLVFEGEGNLVSLSCTLREVIYGS